jgi:creatinine amidohydrolase/Fe(II)-dependent formamide hydrolase-like protein
MIAKSGNTASAAPHELARYTFSEVEREIKRQPALILPLGGCEPYAQFGALGIASACAQSIAKVLSGRMHILVAPLLSYGCSAPLMAFGGSAGVKPRTLVNFLCEAVRMWYFQGFRLVTVVDGLLENREAVDQAQRRLGRLHPGSEMLCFSLQRDQRIREFCSRHASGTEFYRSEHAMLSMAAWIDPGLVRAVSGHDTFTPLPEMERMRTWRKRGADPQQYRKHAPYGSSSEKAGRYDREFGKSLFDYTVTLLEETVTQALRLLQIEMTLGNGMKIIALKKSGAPIVSVQLWYKTGSSSEAEGIRGISHFIEHCMFRGSRRFGSEEHARRINDAGGHCNAFTAEDVTAYVNSVPRDSLEMVLDMEADRMDGLLFDPQLFETERKVIVEEYHTYMNTPVAKAFLEFIPMRSARSAGLRILLLSR